MATPAARAYQDGDTRNLNGIAYVRQGGRWIPSGSGAAPPQTIQIRPPNPNIGVEQESERIRLERERVGLERDRLNMTRDAEGRQAQEAERTAAFLATRVAGGIQDLNEALAEDPTATNVETDAWVAGLFGPEARNYANSPVRRRIEDAQLDILDAGLTLGTGAAYTREQLEGYRQTYFPGVTDDPAQVAAKRRRLLRLLQAARVKAGAAAPQIDAALAALEADPNNAPASGFVRDIIDPAIQTAEAAAAAPGQPAALPGPTSTPPPFMDPGQGSLQTSTDVRTVTDEALARIAPRLGRMITSGRPAREILAYARENGVDPSVIQGSVNSIISQRSNPNSPVAQWIRANPGQPYPVNPTYEEPLSAQEQRGAEISASPVGSAALGLADVGSFGTVDELAALGEGLAGGNRDIGDFRTAMRASAEANPWPYLGGQLAGGFTLPFSRTTNLGRLSLESSAMGGLYGLGSGEGMGRVPTALVGAGIGAAVPSALRGAGMGVRGVRSALVRPATPEAQAIARAAEEEGIQISRPIVDPASRTRMARLEASVGGNAPVQESLAATARGIDERASNLTAGGMANERGAMGQRIQAAAEREHGAEGRRIGRIYDRADTAAGGATVQGTEAVRVLDEHLARLRQNPRTNASMIRFLEDYRADFVDDAGNAIPKTIGAIRDLRTNMRGRINEANLSSSPAEAMISGALDAAKADITRDLGSTAPDALRLYNQADRAWRARAETRRQIVERVIGPADNPISGSQVMDRVRAMASGDTPRLRRLWRLLDPDEQRDAAATIAAAAGRKSPEDDFSPAQFLAWARTITPSARQVVFGPAGARSVENLTILARELRNTRGALNNSRSGMVGNWGQFLRQFSGGGVFGTIAGVATDASALSTGATGLALGAASAGIGAGIRRLSARSLMSPDMTRWLRTATSATTPSAIRAHIGRLSSVAARDPAIAQEATGLQQWLRQAMNDNLERSAVASEADQEQRR